MTIQLSVAVRNARLDAIETAIGTSAIMRLRSGAPPANCAAADSGTLLATINLASDWAGAASAGTKAWNNLPVAFTGAAAGVIGHYRIYASDGTTCHEQGTVTVTGGGGDLTTDNVNIAVSQNGTITGKSLTDGNA